jgi:hypothetical protein
MPRRYRERGWADTKSVRSRSAAALDAGLPPLAWASVFLPTRGLGVPIALAVGW